MHHFPAVAARFRTRLGSRLRSHPPQYHGTRTVRVFTNDVQRPARVEAGLARAALPAFLVGERRWRRPRRHGDSQCRLTQVVHQLQHTHPLSSQKEKTCRIVSNHHQIDSSPRTTTCSQILKRTVFHQSAGSHVSAQSGARPAVAHALHTRTVRRAPPWRQWLIRKRSTTVPGCTARVSPAILA